MKPKKERLKALASRMEIELEFLDECLRQGALSLEEDAEEAGEMSPASLARLRRLERLCHSLGVDAYAGSIIVDLLERMEEMQRELELLREALDIRTR